MSFLLNSYRFAGAAFSPADIANLALWFDADDLSTLWQDDAHTTAVTSNDDPVGAWQSKATGAQYCIQATAGSKPTYKTGVAGSGLAAVYGDGGDHLFNNAGSGFTSDRYVSAFVVANNTAATTYGTVWSTSKFDGNQQYIGCDRRSSPKRLYQITVTGTAVNIDLTSQDDTANFNQLSCIRNDTSAQAWKNGTSQGTSTPTTGNTINNGIRLFAANSAGFLLTGHIAELIAYEAVLSTTDRQSVEAYLKAKWGTP